MSITIGQGVSLFAGVKLYKPPAPVTDGLVQYLDALDYTGSGTTWPAQIGNNATLINGPSWNNTVGYFDFSPGDLQYAEVPNIGDLTNWTVEAWYYLTNGLSSTQATALVTTEYTGNDGNPFYGVINYCLGNDGNPFLMRASFFDGNWHLNDGFEPTTGVWYQSVGTWDGTMLQQYTNGSNIGSVTYGGGPSTANGGPIRIARRWDGPESSEHYFPGVVAIVRIYNKALTGDEIAQNYNANKARFGL